MKRLLKENPNTVDFYDDFYARMEEERVNDWMFPVLKPIVNRQPLKANVIEIGCGLGNTVRWMRSINPKLNYYGTDLSRVAVERAKAKDSKTNYFPCDILSEALPDDFFDLVVCSQVLEHVEKPRIAIQALKRITKPRGTLFITVPYFDTKLDNKVRTHVWSLRPNDFTDELGSVAINRPDKTHLIVKYIKR